MLNKKILKKEWEYICKEEKREREKVNEFLLLLLNARDLLENFHYTKELLELISSLKVTLIEKDFIDELSGYAFSIQELDKEIKILNSKKKKKSRIKVSRSFKKKI